MEVTAVMFKVHYEVKVQKANSILLNMNRCIPGILIDRLVLGMTRMA